MTIKLKTFLLLGTYIPYALTCTIFTGQSAHALDTNNNQISDVWESTYPTAAANLSVDSDGDGISNRDEGLSFTKPNDPSSFFKATDLAQSGSNLTMTFQGEGWMRDLTQESNNLIDWIRDGNPVESDASVFQYNKTNADTRKFVRRVRYNSLNSDTDALTNKEEELLGTNPELWDSDGDKVADDIEFLIGTNPLSNADTDSDGIPDDFEMWCINHSNSDAVTSLNDVTTTTDFDGDSITDLQEFSLGTNPVVAIKNVLFFITEDQSVHLGTYDTNPAGGYAGDSATSADNRTQELQTPNLDSLGAGGVIFDRAFCLSPVCSPSKMALYTGTFPHTNSAHRNVQNYGVDFPLPTGSDPSLTNLGGVHEDLPTLVEILRDRGWYTAVSSKSHVQPVRKFPYHNGHPNLGTPAIATIAMNDVITQAGDRPFFFWANVGAPHLPFRNVPNSNGHWSSTGGLVGDGGVTNIDASKIDVPNCYPDVPGVRQDIADYMGAIEVVDELVQACIDSLSANGILDETLIVFTSDHGLGLHRAKQSIYTAGTQIPLIISGPDVSGNRRIKAPVSHLDIAPTICELMGIPSMPSFQGNSLWPILDGSQNDYPERETMLTACHRYYNARAVTDGRYYYIKNITKPSGTTSNPSLAFNTDQYQAGIPWFNRTYDATMAATGTLGHDLLMQQLTGVGMPDEELYDLDNDLWCTNNLINDPTLQDKIASLRNELSAWRTRTEDYNTDPSEMTRRTARFTNIYPDPVAGGFSYTDDFNGNSGNMDTDPDWSLLLEGNSGTDFTFGSGQVEAPGGAVTLAGHDRQTLPSGSDFKVSVKTGFSASGVASGLAFGIVADTGSYSFWQFMLADGRSTPGGTEKDVRIFRVNAGAQQNPPLLKIDHLDNYSTNGELFTLEVSGTSGSSLVDLRIFRADGSTYYSLNDFDLGQNVPANSSFGITSWASGNSVFDDFNLQLTGPFTHTLAFEQTENLNAQADWTTLKFGNSSADFSHLAAPFSLSGNALKAAAGPLMLASYDPITLGTGKTITATLDAGYEAVGGFGGLVFGLTDEDNWYSIELADGQATIGAAVDRLIRVRKSNSGSISNLLNPAANSLPIITRDRFFRISLTATEGSSTIIYSITDPSTSTTLTSGSLDLGSPLTAGSKFGITANASANTYYDNLTITTD